MIGAIADTHALIWYLLDSPRLSAPASAKFAATALHLGVPLITRDRKIELSSVETIW